MHKKLASELSSLAHSILQMKNKDDVFALKQKAHEIYEKLSVLAYVEQYINTTPQATETKEELIAKIVEVEEKNQIAKELDSVKSNDFVENVAEEFTEKTKEDSISEKVIEKLPNSVEEDVKQPFSKIEEKTKVIEKFDKKKEDLVDFKEGLVNEDINNAEFENTPKVEEHKNIEVEEPINNFEELRFTNDNAKFNEADFIEEQKALTLEEELKDTISVDVTANLFEKAEPKKSLNDQLQNTIQIGLNDRIAFVKHLFNGDAADFNRVVSQLNTFETEKEAKKFINKTVKPNYNWVEKEEYETRFFEIVERRFA